MKCSAVKVDGHWREVYKDPITDLGKRSKRGRLGLVKDGDKVRTVPEYEAEGQDLLQTVFENGVLVKETTFDEVRENAKL